MLISLSKKKSKRSKMLKVIMKHLSNEDLQKAIINKNPSKFAVQWDKIGKDIVQELTKDKK